MDQGLLPRRYAKAFFKFALEKKFADRAYVLMHNLDASFDTNPALSQVIANPYVDGARKIEILKTAAGATDDDVPLTDFFKLLVQNRRIDLVRQMALAYNQLYQDANNIYDVRIDSAAPLSDQDVERIKSMIQHHLKGATAQYTFNVNPDLIGGFVVTIDSQRLDASVKNELEQLRLNLLK